MNYRLDERVQLEFETSVFFQTQKTGDMSNLITYFQEDYYKRFIETITLPVKISHKIGKNQLI